MQQPDQSLQSFLGMEDARATASGGRKSQSQHARTTSASPDHWKENSDNIVSTHINLGEDTIRGPLSASQLENFSVFEPDSDRVSFDEPNYVSFDYQEIDVPSYAAVDEHYTDLAFPPNASLYYGPTNYHSDAAHCPSITELPFYQTMLPTHTGATDGTAWGSTVLQCAASGNPIWRDVSSTEPFSSQVQQSAWPTYGPPAASGLDVSSAYWKFDLCNLSDGAALGTSQDDSPYESSVHRRSFSDPDGVYNRRSASTGDARASETTLKNSLPPDTAYACCVESCLFQSESQASLAAHTERVHGTFICHECQTKFTGARRLDNHAWAETHTAYACSEEGCTSTFSRYDVYQRHKTNHLREIPRFPCPHCKRHRGTEGFKRKDHLTQHLRNYHHHHIGNDKTRNISRKSCRHEGCPEYRKDPERTWPYKHAFKKTAEYTTHMRKVHNESDYPCPAPGCDRVKGKGYFRERDLIKHQRKEHPEAEGTQA